MKKACKGLRRDMAQIELRLSNKVQKMTGRREIMIRFYQGSRFDLYSKSDVFIDPEYFEYYINLAKSAAAGVKVAGNIITCTESKARKNGYILRKSGMIVIKQRLETPEVKYHRQQLERLDKMSKYILDRYAEVAGDVLSSEWLTETVDRFNHPEKYHVKASEMTIYELIELYISRKHLVETNARVYRVLSRAIGRYEGYVRATDPARKNYTFSIHHITREDIESFSSYLKNEKALSIQYPQLFERLIKDNPACGRKGKNVIQERGDNYIIKERAGVRVGILGVCPQPEGLITGKNFEGMRYTKPAKAAQPVIDRLRNEEHCDVVICLSHLGWGEKPDMDPDFIAATTGLDVVLGGHSHTYFKEPQYLHDKKGHEVLVDHQGKNARFLGTIEIKTGFHKE